MPPPSQFDKVEQECRNRLFWAAYVLDRQIGIVFGRPVIFHDQDIDVEFPGLIDEEGVGLDGQQSSGEVNQYQGGDSQGLMGSAEMSLRVYRALIQVCRCFEQVRSIYALEEGSEDDIIRLREVEHQLDRAWDMFPSELTDLLSDQPLDIAALRPLLDAQHARLLLYRSFTDFSKPLQPTWRTFCLAQSVHTCKVSARLLLRCTYLPDWDTEFALKSNETVRIHAFRAAALLLLGYSINDPAVERVEKNDVLVCIKALKASSERHHSMMKPMQMIEGLARMFGCDIHEVRGPLERTIVDGVQNTSDTSERDVSTPPEPMEWANFSGGNDISEKPEQQAQPRPIQSQNAEFPPPQRRIPNQEQEQQQRQTQQQQQHPGLQSMQPFDALQRTTSQQQALPYSATGGQNAIFPSSETSGFNRTQPRAGFRAAPGVLTPIITQASPGLSTGLPTTPSVVSSMDGLMLSPIQRAQSSAPALSVSSPQLPPVAQSHPSASTSGMFLPPPPPQQQQHSSQSQSQQQPLPIHAHHPLLSPTPHFPPSDLSTAGVIDWDAFQNMMTVDQHGFGELLTAGPEAAWGYVGNSTGVPGVPGLASMAERHGYAGPPTTAEEDRRRSGRGRGGEVTTEPQRGGVKAEDWTSG